MRNQATKRAARRRKVTTNQANIQIISTKKDHTKRAPIIMMTMDTSMKMDTKNITDTKKNMARKAAVIITRNGATKKERVVIKSNEI